MPAYNVQDYIAEAIDSVLSQTVLPDELIIVNDGSTDKTRDVISSYEYHPIVNVVDKKNEGLGPARNTGLNLSGSDFVYFFDSDDLLPIFFVEKFFLYLSRCPNADLIVFSGDVFHEHDCADLFSPPDYKRKVDGCFKSGLELYWELSKSKSLFASACLYISRRKIWCENGLSFKSIVHEDEDILFPLYMAVTDCYSTSDVLFLRRVRPGSIMTSGFNEKNLLGINAAIETMLEFRKQESSNVSIFKKCWRHRMRGLVVNSFRRSLAIGELFPTYTMARALFSVFGVKVLFLIFGVYFSYFKKKARIA